MSIRFQFVRWTLGVALCGAVCLPGAAQKYYPVAQQRPPQGQNRPPQKPPKPPKQNQGNPNRPPVNQARNAVQPPPAAHQNPGTETGTNNAPGRNLTPRQQLGVGAPGPWVQSMRQMRPADRERFFQNSPAFHNMPPERQSKIRQQFNQWDRMTPQQKADQIDKENVWRSLSPEQKNHIKNDVLPNWRQMSPERQQAIQQKLSILKNMPESARNRRLNDPKFTEGMSEEDKATLRDLSHMHIGGAPDPPGE